MGLAPAAHVLFNKFMTFNPKNPNWVNRDRFVLSYVSFPFLTLDFMIVEIRNEASATLSMKKPTQTKTNGD